MVIRHIRLDSRLIHGQVASFWANFLGINRIIVISSRASSDKVQIEMLKMACPVGVKLSVLSPSSLITKFEKDQYKGDVILVITDTVQTLHEVIKTEGITKYISEINVGNLSTSDGKIMVKKSVFVSKEEYLLFQQINDLGVKVDAKMVPNDESINFINLLNDKCKEEKWN